MYPFRSSDSLFCGSFHSHCDDFGNVRSCIFIICFMSLFVLLSLNSNVIFIELITSVGKESTCNFVLVVQTGYHLLLVHLARCIWSDASYDHSTPL